MNLNKRRPYYEDQPDGYAQSDKDYVLNNLELAVALLDQYHQYMRVVCTAWDVIEHRAEDYLDNTIPPYSNLKAALEKLAKGEPDS